MINYDVLEAKRIQREIEALKERVQALEEQGSRIEENRDGAGQWHTAPAK